jgi:acetyl esterase/lipase
LNLRNLCNLWINFACYNRVSMTISPAERNMRRMMPLIRLMQSYLPLSWSGGLNRWSLRHARLPAGVSRQPVSADGVPCDWLIPDSDPGDRALLYLHGGGFVYGQTLPHLQMGATLAQKLGGRVLMVDYRLAPAHPFPAALDDCVSAYRWLRRQGFPARRIAIAGDSAGGNLTLTTLMKLRDSGDALPVAGACLSPVANLSRPAGSAQPDNDPMLPAKAIEMYSRSYVADNDPRDPLISPVFGDWRGLPPLLIHAAEDESLRNDAEQIEKLARAAGVDVRLEVYPRMWHVWQLTLAMPQAIQSLDDIAGFLKARL